MKVAFIVNQFPMLSETFILNQATGLIDLGHEVDIYTTYSADLANATKMHPAVETYRLLDRTTYAQTPPTNRIWRTLLGFWLLITNFHKAPLALLRSLNGFKYGWQATSLKLVYAVVPLLGKGPYDIIHCQFSTLTFIGAIVRPSIGTSKAKLVVSCRGHDISAYMQEVDESIHKQLFAVGDVFLPNCDFFKHRLLKLGCPEKKIVVLRSGIDCDRFPFTPRFPPADAPTRIVTSGRLTEKKGVDYGIRAIANLVQANRPVEYLIVGDGPLRKSLEQLINTLNLNTIVKLVGWMQQQELIEVLDRSHIFLAPNVTAKDGNQDAPVNTIKEALAMGLPVVSTWHGGIPEVVEDGVSGFLVAERDAEALAEKLQYLIDHSEIWHDMGRAGRDYVESCYDSKTLNTELARIYEHQLLS
jgi:colanic acid/amylovoran biosynthesis glycosyltransferase